MDESTLSPSEERARHEAGIMETIPAPKWKNVASRDLVQIHYINEFEEASQARVRYYRDTFSEALVGALLVNDDRGRFELLDGRHRTLSQKGRPRMWHCEVQTGLTKEQKAALFFARNDHRRTPGVKEKFYASVMIGDPVATVANGVIVTRGVSGEIQAYGALLKAIENSPSIPEGEQALNFALRVLIETFPHDKGRLNGTLMQGVARYFNLHGSNPKLSEKRLQNALSRNGNWTAAQLLSKAVEEARTSGPGGVTWVCRLIEQRYTP